ncbi:MAG: hypothetical protein ACLP7O_00240 [Terracidiphilus sp.]
MAYLKSQATQEFRDAVLAVERRSDDCWTLMRLLKQPRNLATWALLTRMALELEMLQQNYGVDSLIHRDQMTLWDLCTCGFSFIASHGRPASKLIHTYTWNRTLAADATSAMQISREYTNFLNIFPMWHLDMQGADVLSDGRVRFAFERDSPGQRRVIAFQQRFRPHIGMRDAITHHRMQLNSEQERQFAELREIAQSRGSTKKLRYEPPAELIRDVLCHSLLRVDESFRYPDGLELDEYSLGEFKSFYAGLLTLCAIHERICYPFLERGHQIPESSLVMVKTRRTWIEKLADISRLPVDKCEKIVTHLTMDPSPGKETGMTVYPFIPLDGFNQELAVAPQFPLAARSDDNILRAFSYRSNAEFSRINQKEPLMRSRILAANGRFNIPEPVRLPNGKTNIDLIIEDAQSSTLVLAELKWIRKPLTPKERKRSNAEIEKGLQQVQLVRDYARTHPDFLKRSQRITRTVNSYANIHYLLIVADHWFWIDPEDSFAILDFQVFLTQFATSTNLQDTISDLLTYNWLPIEGVNFSVDFEPSSVNGAVIESPTFRHIR